MADPRFYDNRGPFALADLCTRMGVELGGADGNATVLDVAALEAAGPQHLSFCSGKAAAKALAQSGAGFCLIPKDFVPASVPPGMILIKCPSVPHVFVAAAAAFYPETDFDNRQTAAIDPSAKIGADVRLAPGVVIGPNAEIGEGTRIGPNTVIGRGVTIGRNGRIGANVTISHTCAGDDVVIYPGAELGQPGFGYANSARGHVMIPQLGRLIIQDKVEIGAGCAFDRGGLGDTVLGEGSKFDNLVHIGHNNHFGRHCLIAGQAGFAGSSVIGDFFASGGQIGVADHARIGDFVRLAGRTGIMPGELAGGQDYGGVPARPIKEWAREVAALKALAKRRGKKDNG